MSWFKPWTWFRTVRESVSAADIFGTPDTDRFTDWLNRRTLTSIWALDPYRDKATTIRTLPEQRRAVTISRALFEANPNASGLCERITDYAVACGSSCDVQSTDEQGTPPVRLTKSVKTTLKQFKEANTWQELEEEIVRRLITDGEFFLLLEPDEEGPTLASFIEPQMIQPPQGEDHNGPWSFGIHTPNGRTDRPEAYNVHDFATGADTQIDAVYVVHGKVGVVRNAKRGIPMLWAASVELQGSERLRYASREGLKAREAVAYFRTHESATQAAVQALQDANASGSYDRTNADGSTQTTTYQTVEPGSVVDIPKQMQPAPPPGSPNGDATHNAVQMALEAVAARFGVPAWVVTGSSDAANFAASLTAESPMVKNLDRFQAKLSRWVDAALTKVVEIEVEKGSLPEDTLEQIDLIVTFPSPVVRNAKEETDRRALLNERGVMSKNTWQSEEGLDPEKENAQIAQEATPVGTPPGSVPPSTSPGARYTQLTGSREN